jgi:HEAT repeat protein
MTEIDFSSHLDVRIGHRSLRIQLPAPAAWRAAMIWLAALAAWSLAGYWGATGFMGGWQNSKWITIRFMRLWLTGWFLLELWLLAGLLSSIWSKTTVALSPGNLRLGRADLFGTDSEASYEIAKIRDLHASCERNAALRSLAFDYENRRKYSGSIRDVAHLHWLEEGLQTCFRVRCDRVERVMFGLHRFTADDPDSMLRNSDISERTMPLFSLRQILIDTAHCDEKQVERFMINACRIMGRHYLAHYVDAHLYGPANLLSPRLRMAMMQFCRTTTTHSAGTTTIPAIPPVSALSERKQQGAPWKWKAAVAVAGLLVIAALIPFLMKKTPEQRLTRQLHLLNVKGMEDTNLKAAEALAQSDDPRAFEALLAAAQHHREYTVRQIAAEALGASDDPRVFDVLCEVMQRDSSYSVRKIAAQSLAKSSDPRVFDTFLTALRHNKSYGVQEIAAYMVGQADDPRAFDALVETLHNDSGYDIRENAVEALSQSDDPRAFEVLRVELLCNVNSSTRAIIAKALFTKNDPRALEQFRYAVYDQMSPLQPWAVAFLGVWHQEPHALETLIMAFRDTTLLNVHARMDAAKALGDIDDPQALDALLSGLNDPESRVREVTAKHLGKHRHLPKVADALQRALKKDASPKVRDAAAEALEHGPSPGNGHGTHRE